jgi:hypothetical protein
MMKTPDSVPARGVTRRDFARGAAIAAAAATVPLTACSPCGDPKSEEAEAMYHAILRHHGKQFTTEQKKELRAQMDGVVQGLAALRAYPLENWDEPAAVPHLPANPAPPAAKPASRGGR